jgi:putative transposase
MRKSFKYRLYPTKEQIEKFEFTLSICCELYNAALQERIEAWKLQRKSISFFDQCHELIEVKLIRSECKKIYGSVLRDPLNRVDKAFKNFFRRCKSGDKRKGYPRFKSFRRYDSFAYPDAQGFSIKEESVVLSKIGDVKCKFHRPIQGKIKTCTIKREADEWYVIFSCDFVSGKLLPNTGEEIGIDIGIENFAALSNGEMIGNPRYAKRASAKLRRAQRALARKKRGSNRRKKAVLRVAKCHLKIKRQRRDYHFKVASMLVKKFDVIHFEKLNIRNMVRNKRLAFSISDAAWYQFQQITTWKAEEAAKRTTFNDARNSSNECSMSGEIKKKSLGQRWHTLPTGEKIHRDTNAAINIKRRGQRRQSVTDGL